MASWRTLHAGFLECRTHPRRVRSGRHDALQIFCPRGLGTSGFSGLDGDLDRQLHVFLMATVRALIVAIQWHGLMSGTAEHVK